MTKQYHERFQELIKIYNEKLGSRDCYLLYDYLIEKDKLSKNKSTDSPDFYDVLFSSLEEKAKEKLSSSLLTSFAHSQNQAK